MCDLGLSPEDFNPRVLYLLKMRKNSENRNDIHTHDFFELNYVVSGSLTYNIDGVLYPVKKGDILACCPGIPHKRMFAPDEEATQLHMGLSNIYIKNLPENCLIKPGDHPIISPVQFEQDFLKCYSEIILEQEQNNTGCDLVLKTLAMKFIILFLRETYHVEKSSAGNFSFEYNDRSDIVSAVTSYINENYMHNISLDKIAKNMYLSPVYISKVFKDETGDSPINHLIKIRLNKARELLEESRLSVKTVAESVGYSDAYHFSKLYKKYFGCPPSKHRL